MAREESRGKRPFKLWDGHRSVRKGLVVGSLEELVQRGREKLGVSVGEPVRLVLECDGTQVEDTEYFRTLPPNSILLLLRPGERWLPAGVDVIRAVSAIPRIVCETINALELQDETPSWKIMDNKGRVTVVLHWDQRSGPSRTSSEAPSPAPGKFSPSKRPSLVMETRKKETVINDVYVPPAAQQPPQRYTSPQITVINHDDVKPVHRLAKQGSSLESSTIHIHTPECAHHVHLPRAGSPQNGAIECDFHCCALHEEGRKIAVHKSVATSPIQEPQQTSPQPPSRHVRFLDIEGGGRGGQSEHESSESETENTVMEDEAVTSEKFLLLIDQLSVDQKRHLSIKDIGIILERLNSKILDVERLDRESENDDCYNWTIKATIRGADMRELGVIYNGNYYAISEHPGYKEENEGVLEEVEEEEEEEDRL